MLVATDTMKKKQKWWITCLNYRRANQVYQWESFHSTTLFCGCAKADCCIAFVCPPTAQCSGGNSYNRTRTWSGSTPSVVTTASVTRAISSFFTFGVRPWSSSIRTIGMVILILLLYTSGRATHSMPYFVISLVHMSVSIIDQILP